MKELSQGVTWLNLDFKKLSVVAAGKGDLTGKASCILFLVYSLIFNSLFEQNQAILICVRGSTKERVVRHRPGFSRGLASPEVNMVERTGFRGSSLPGEDKTKEVKINITRQLTHLVFQ